MEVKIIESDKNRLVFEVVGETNTFCNVLREELWNDKSVTAAVYKIEHPMVGIPRFIVETDGKKSPKDALVDATKRIKKLSAEFRKELGKL